MKTPHPPPTHFERELREQPEALARLLDRGRATAEALGERIRRFQPRFVLIAARGSSDNAARYAKHLFGVRHGLATALASPSLVTRYDSTLQVADALVLGVSQSGQSPDVVATVEHGRKQGALTIALTNDVSSPLACASEACFPLEAGEERAVAATKTYTNQVLAFAMLSAAIASDAQAWNELLAVPESVRRTIRMGADIDGRVAAFRESTGFVVVGRGYNLGTAYEIALKTMEMTYIMAQPFPVPDIFHGPVAMMGPNLPLVAVATSGSVVEDVIEFIQVARGRGAPVIAISDRDDVLAPATVALPVSAGVPEWVSPIHAVVPGQLWALALTQALGLPPDTPRGLRKVTETE